MKREALDHPKLADLAEELEELGVPAEFSLATATGVLERLWGLTARHAPDGDLSRFRARRIADYLGWRRDVAGLLAALQRTGWLDRAGERLAVHDWPTHADGQVHRKMIRKGELFADGTAPTMTYATRAEREAWPAKRAEAEHTVNTRRAHGEVESGSLSQSPSQSPEPDASGGGAPRRSREPPVEEEEGTNGLDVSPPGPPKWALLRLLSKRPGTDAEKRAWFLDEWPCIEAEAQLQATKRGTSEQEELRRAVVAFYDTYLANGQREHAPGPREAVH